MQKRVCLATLVALILGLQSYGQTTNGLLTGLITDPSGAVVSGAQVSVTNEETAQVRKASSAGDGTFIVPQLPPGVYDVSVSRQGFTTEKRPAIQLEVNQNINLDFKLTVSSTVQMVEVTGAPPALNTTSATLSDVVGHDATVDLPLNGREFTQLTLLTPGAAPVQTSQQGQFTVALGAGGISPSVNGQRGEQNNFTMDGVLNNSIFTNVWAIAPPPDAIQEFNVQSHITDAQFAISSGANINVVTRSGTNDFHGSLWEFFRNDALDAQTFPETQRLPYRQNQYGAFMGGPILFPHFRGRDNTWFAAYWEGFRSSLSTRVLASTLTPAMMQGDFSGVLGAPVGTDSLGRPEYADQIYDPATSRPDPKHPSQFLRDPFPGNVIPSSRINPATALILQKYYPAPNLNVAPKVLPNLEFTGLASTASDVTGIRLDHRFPNNDMLFGRFNRSNANLLSPEQLPGYSKILGNYALTYAVGYAHIFNTKTILNLHFGYTKTTALSVDEPAGAAFANSVGFSEAVPERDGIALGPQVILSNGYSTVLQIATPLGPQNNEDYHADLSKTVGSHTLGIGGMFYHIRSYSDGWKGPTIFTQNGSSQDGTSGPTGFGPASFILGVVDQYKPWTGNSSTNQTEDWYGGYVQDLWRPTGKLAVTIGLRYDFITPPNFHKIVSALDVLTGQFIVTGAVPSGGFPSPTGPSGFFYPQYNGFQPRFGAVYQASNRTVVHGAFAMLDDHNNPLVQQNDGLRLSWPSGVSVNLTSLDLGLPKVFINKLPTAAALASPTPVAGPGANPHNRIPYSMEYNFGIQEQISNTINFRLDYVGSVSRHQFTDAQANTALVPGPGVISARQPYPQYGGPQAFEWNSAPASYNALQAALNKSLSSGLFFMASYTWSKSLDYQSDPYSTSIQDFYHMSKEWGPSSYSLGQMVVLSGVYALPLGRGKSIASNSNRLVQAVAGNWNVGSIITLDSGLPFNALAGTDVANTGGTSERAQRTGANPYAAPGFQRTAKTWLNKAAFAAPAQYTFGNERRDDLVGPGYKDVDFNAFKEFPFAERARVEFRGELFNLLNHTNYAVPINNVQSAAFGAITSAAGPGRVVQFAVKIIF